MASSLAGNKLAGNRNRADQLESITPGRSLASTSEQRLVTEVTFTPE